MRTEYFERLQQSDGYQSQDLIVLHPEHSQPRCPAARVYAIHTHDDDEVRYIVDGEGIFGFVMPDNQILLTVEAGEYINVPAGTEHWFVLTATKRIKAVRYFTTMDGWSKLHRSAHRDHRMNDAGSLIKAATFYNRGWMLGTAISARINECVLGHCERSPKG